MFEKSLGQHILCNPLIITSMVDKVSMLGIIDESIVIINNNRQGYVVLIQY